MYDYQRNSLLIEFVQDADEFAIKTLLIYTPKMINWNSTERRSNEN